MMGGVNFAPDAMIPISTRTLKNMETVAESIMGMRWDIKEMSWLKRFRRDPASVWLRNGNVDSITVCRSLQCNSAELFGTICFKNCAPAAQVRMISKTLRASKPIKYLSFAASILNQIRI